jgi:hypothetical protein
MFRLEKNPIVLWLNPLERSCLRSFATLPTPAPCCLAGSVLFRPVAAVQPVREYCCTVASKSDGQSLVCSGRSR